MNIARCKSYVVGILLAIGIMAMPSSVFALNVGEACSGSCDVGGGTCTTGVGCFCDAAFGGRCVALRAAGETCTSASECQTGLYCPDAPGNRCTARLVSRDETPDTYCWCKKTDGTCENHRLNDAPAGSKSALICDTSGGVLDGTSAQDTHTCLAYCRYRGMRAVRCESTYHNYLAGDSLPDTDPNHCKPMTAVAPATPTTSPTAPAGMGDGGENRTSPTDFGLQNPLGTTDVRTIMSKIIRAVLGVVGALFLVMFVYGGVMWMTAGDSKRVDTAKKTFVNAVIGMAIVAFSYSMVSLVFSLAGQVAGG